MPDGKVHVAAAIVAILPSGAAAAGASCYGWLPVAVAEVAYLVGTIWLSPDLDLVSQPYMAWGPLRWIWWPYMKLVPHRSWWSHGPVIGTLARVASLVTVSAAVTAALVGWSVITLDQVRGVLTIDLWAILSVLAGLECSALVHIGLDQLLKN